MRFTACLAPTEEASQLATLGKWLTPSASPELKLFHVKAFQVVPVLPFHQPPAVMSPLLSSAALAGRTNG